MARLPKVKRRGGRKPGIYSTLSPGSRLIYHQLGTAKWQSKEVGQDGDSSGSKSSFEASSSKSCFKAIAVESDSNVKQGRPPLDGVVGPMSPGTLADRRRSLNKEQYSVFKIRKVRQAAVSQRKDRRSLENEDQESNLSDDAVDDGEGDKACCSSKTVIRRKKEFLECLPSDICVRGELLKHLV